MLHCPWVFCCNGVCCDCAASECHFLQAELVMKDVFPDRDAQQKQNYSKLGAGLRGPLISHDDCISCAAFSWLKVMVVRYSGRWSSLQVILHHQKCAQEPDCWRMSSTQLLSRAGVVWILSWYPNCTSHGNCGEIDIRLVDGRPIQVGDKNDCVVRMYTLCPLKFIVPSAPTNKMLCLTRLLWWLKCTSTIGKYMLDVMVNLRLDKVGCSFQNRMTNGTECIKGQATSTETWETK